MLLHRLCDFRLQLSHCRFLEVDEIPRSVSGEGAGRRPSVVDDDGWIMAVVVRGGLVAAREVGTKDTQLSAATSEQGCAIPPNQFPNLF